MEELESLDPSSLEFAQRLTEVIDIMREDPLERFIKNPWFMNFEPTLAQTVALKCTFGQELNPLNMDGVWMETKDENDVFALERLMMSEIDLYKFMTGFEYDPEKQHERNKLNLIIGRRGGKTTISAMLALFCAIKMNWKPYLKKATKAAVIILSHSREFSDEVLGMIKNFVDESPILKKLVDTGAKQTQQTFHLKIPFWEDGKISYSKVAIRVGTANKKNVRGWATCTLLCDEIAYWNLDENAAEPDSEILKAARPALLQFGQHGMLIKLSSPGIKQGVLYNEYNMQLKGELPPGYITLKAPSWVWNTILMESAFKEEYIIDPVGFDSEYRANFVDSISNFILPEFVDLCTRKGRMFDTPETKKTDVTYCAALDAAFKGDRFAFTLMGWNGNRLKQYVMHTWKGSRANPVKAMEVAEYIRNVCKEFGVAQVHADQFAFQPLREIFDQFGVTLVENVFTNTFKKQIYFNLKNVVHNQVIDLLDHEILCNEIKQLQVEQTNTGTIRIGHPPGGTDDCSDCTAVASWLLSERMHATGISPGQIAEATDYGIRKDATGRAFDAPSPEMLSPLYGREFHDNLSDYRLNPITKKWERIEDDDDPDGGNDDGSGIIMA